MRGRPKKRWIERIENDTKLAVASKEEVGCGGVDPYRCIGQWVQLHIVRSDKDEEKNEFCEFEKMNYLRTINSF